MNADIARAALAFLFRLGVDGGHIKPQEAMVFCQVVAALEAIVTPQPTPVEEAQSNPDIKRASSSASAHPSEHENQTGDAIHG